MKIPKLGRAHEYEINAHRTDCLSLWPSLFHDDRHNLSLEDESGDRILAVYGTTREQLLSLHREIEEVLGEA